MNTQRIMLVSNKLCSKLSTETEMKTNQIYTTILVESQYYFLYKHIYFLVQQSTENCETTSKAQKKVKRAVFIFFYECDIFARFYFSAILSTACTAQPVQERGLQLRVPGQAIQALFEDYLVCQRYKPINRYKVLQHLYSAEEDGDNDDNVSPQNGECVCGGESKSSLGKFEG